MRTLIAITVFAGILRFLRLWHPPLLIDECFTFWRVCGSYADLVGTLQNDGFFPLHYELLWWIGQGLPIGWGFKLIPHGIPLTPSVIRFVPAVMGAAMSPVIYFTARQLFPKRTALVC